MTFSEMIRALRKQEIRIVSIGWDQTGSEAAWKCWLAEDLTTLYHYWVRLPQGWV